MGILQHKSWNVYSGASRRRVARDEARAGARPPPPDEPAACALGPIGAAPWYARPEPPPRPAADADAEEPRLLDGDPLIAMRAHDERAERRRRKLRDIAREAAPAPDGRCHKKLSKKRKRKRKKASPQR
ncbi:hypothetical protein H4R18_000692 [Coemansia javaensis]|uniref:Uncharacterized protein n=1 Tax=Coemansia javaensis TaxID=2761396 RepID=A0A9W8HLT7_9FUNG|nr:hypothetical protein H4R18_000692 [Coemansia javaensis]